MNLVINLCLSIFVLVALLLVLVILMQRPKSEGLGAAFGAAVTENIFGAQTTNVLTRITAWLAGIFFVLTFVLAVLYAHRNAQNSGLRGELLKTQGATQAMPSPANPALSPSPASGQSSPASSAAPDSGAGVLPAGTATAVPSLSIAEPAASPVTTPKPKPKRNR